MPRSSADVQVMRRPSKGRAMMERLPSLIVIGCVSVNVSRGSACSTTPHWWMSVVKGRAEPSTIGGSEASSSMMALSTAMPLRAERTCSMVCSLTVSEETVVFRSSSVIISETGRTSGLPKRSMRRNTRPLFGAPGLRVRVTSWPVWRALPLTEASLPKVRCFMPFTQLFTPPSLCKGLLSRGLGWNSRLRGRGGDRGGGRPK